MSNETMTFIAVFLLGFSAGGIWMWLMMLRIVLKRDKEINHYAKLASDYYTNWKRMEGTES